jgi:Family of unknown function (DUF5681)
MSAGFDGSDGEAQNYQVGYKRPPRHTQFQKGCSGNPRGRRKRPAEYRDILLRVLNQKHAGIVNGKRRSMTSLELGLTRLANSAAMGDRLALRDLITDMERFGIKLSTGPGGGLIFIIEE